MKINIKKLSHDKEHLFENTLLPEIFTDYFDAHDEFKSSIKLPFEVKVNVYFAENTILVKCSYKTILKPLCMSCLDEFSLPINETFERAFFKAESQNPEDYTYKDEDELEIMNFNKNELNIIPLLLEHVCLITPISYRCSESCKGLCPVCGANKNHEKCNCTKKE